MFLTPATYPILVSTPSVCPTQGEEELTFAKQLTGGNQVQSSHTVNGSLELIPVRASLRSSSCSPSRTSWGAQEAGPLHSPCESHSAWELPLTGRASWYWQPSGVRVIQTLSEIWCAVSVFKILTLSLESLKIWQQHSFPFLILRGIVT